MPAGHLPHRPRGWRLGGLIALLALALWLTGCATPPRPAPIPGEDQWQGRLALRVDSDPQQHVSAGFELRGNALRGELALSSPLGQVLAVAEWTPTGARLRQGGQVREYPDLDSLTQDLMGTTLPLAALFDWLHGQAQAVPGWEVDLSGHADGRLFARRQQPLPGAELRLRLQGPHPHRHGRRCRCCATCQRRPSSTCSCTSPAGAPTATTCCSRSSC